jgi:hypothetical protein
MLSEHLLLTFWMTLLSTMLGQYSSGMNNFDLSNALATEQFEPVLSSLPLSIRTSYTLITCQGQLILQRDIHESEKYMYVARGPWPRMAWSLPPWGDNTCFTI